MNSSRSAIWLSLLVLALASLACGIGPRATVLAEGGCDDSAKRRSQRGILPTTRPRPTAQPRSVVTAGSAQACRNERCWYATPSRAAKAAQPSPTLDPKRIVITEEDIIQALRRRREAKSKGSRFRA